MLKYGTGPLLVSCICKLIKSLGDQSEHVRGNQIHELSPRAPGTLGGVGTIHHADASLPVDSYTSKSLRPSVYYWFGGVVRLYSIATTILTWGLKPDACVAPLLQ